jgi:hypothetical protein
MKDKIGAEDRPQAGDADSTGAVSRVVDSSPRRDA